jgi:hypothetical protein
MNRVDEHGKIFTERVRKTCVEVTVLTVQSEIQGYMHIMPDERVRDVLNNNEQFIAVTDAEAKIQGRLERLHVDFIAINKLHIISVIPVDEDKVKRQQAEEYYWPA